MGKGKTQQFGVNQRNQKRGEAAGDEQSSTEHPRAVPIRPPERPAVLSSWREGENCRKRGRFYDYFLSFTKWVEIWLWALLTAFL